MYWCASKTLQVVINVQRRQFRMAFRQKQNPLNSGCDRSMSTKNYLSIAGVRDSTAIIEVQLLHVAMTLGTGSFPEMGRCVCLSVHYQNFGLSSPKGSRSLISGYPM